MNARALIARLGPDPLRDDADPDLAWKRIHRSKLPIGQLLMDQEVLSGVGNVYRAEVLFRAKLHPKTPGHLVKKREWQGMWTDLLELMKYGVETGRIDTVDRRPHPGARWAATRARTTTAARSTCTAGRASTAMSAIGDPDRDPGRAQPLLVSRSANGPV